MANKTQTIRIESILGGHSPMTHFSAPDQFMTSLGIDPFSAVSDTSSDIFAQSPCGLLRPSPSEEVSTGQVPSAPMWISATPKVAQVYYVYGHGGSLSTMSISGSVTPISDAGLLSGGNGFAYYDNYIYLFKGTDIARYGPLDGTPTIDGSYWVGTLGKAALTDTTYPTFNTSTFLNRMNHLAVRHSDGKLYFGDVVGNIGTIHYIKTTKTTVEGDTDAGSTYGALSVGYGLWPTAIESYGDILVIAFYEGTGGSGNVNKMPAKIAFWDTTANKVNSISWPEFPDPLVTAIKNVNGVLYFFSSNNNGFNADFNGVRVTQYIGGNTFKEVFQSNSAYAPTQGGVLSHGSRLYFGARTDFPESSACVYMLDTSTMSVFNVMRVPDSTGDETSVCSLAVDGQQDFITHKLIAGWADGLPAVTSSGGIAFQKSITAEYNNAPSVWWSQMYRIGQPFKITKIRIPLAQTIASNMIVTPKIYTDNGNGNIYTGGSSSGFAIINNTNYSGKTNVVFRPQNMTGQHNFWLELRWTGSTLCTVGLPITIEYELIDD